MSIKRLFDAVERRGDIGRRVAALVLPISNRPRVTSSCASKIGLREPGEHTSGPNLASRDNVAHAPTLYTILELPPPGAVLPPSNEYFSGSEKQCGGSRVRGRRPRKNKSRG